MSFLYNLFAQKVVDRVSEDYRHSAFGTHAELKKFRYCWMHGISNMLQNALLLLYDNAPHGSKVRLTSEVQKFAPHWA
jgi:hypothetical protein